MENNTNVGNASGSNTGATTDNPQATGQTGRVGEPQNPQNLVSTNSINNQSGSIGIPLQPGSQTTAPISATTPKQTHKIATAAFIPIGLLIIVALASCLYIYVTSKKSAKNL